MNVQISARIPVELRDFQQLASAKLRVSREEIVIAALAMYREFLERSGIID